LLSRQREPFAIAANAGAALGNITASEEETSNEEI
jgi:hypothetical protein